MANSEVVDQAEHTALILWDLFGKKRAATEREVAQFRDKARTLLLNIDFTPDPPAHRLSLEPLPTEQWFALPEREQSLQTIADCIAYWLQWVTRTYEAEGMTIEPDSNIILPGEGAPPYWPSVGQLGRWLVVLRDSGSGAKR